MLISYLVVLPERIQTAKSRINIKIITETTMPFKTTGVLLGTNIENFLGFVKLYF
jgi:hypothetical protein